VEFALKLELRQKESQSLLAINLDPDIRFMPPEGSLDFNRRIIETTSDIVSCYKLNLAFYEAWGMEGLSVLKKTLECIPEDIPVIGDGKRGDIENSSRFYAQALFEFWDFDATTVNPYLGFDSLLPFVDYSQKGVFVLCHTSNPGGDDLQSLPVGDVPLFEVVIHKVASWGRKNVGLVVGANRTLTLRRVREICPEVLILIPGIGVQGGRLDEAVKYGGRRAIYAVGRRIIYASRDLDFALRAREEAQKLRWEINKTLFESGD
jgi:orotidine-5'-phosphate decarboxylase